MAISKRLRYEVLRRDNHTCRYCGVAAPEVVLTVDHVTPVALGGGDDPGNLVAACRDCNSGKSATPVGAPLVEDVASDAVRWKQAMQAAATLDRKRVRHRNNLKAKFTDAWHGWTQRDGSTIPIARTWDNTVDQFLDAGMPMDMLLECISIAMMSKAAVDDKWRYMCGVGWRKLSRLQDEAAALMKSAEVDL